MRRLQRGFTLVETLAALLIVSLLTAAIVAGTSAATGIYGDARFAAESEILASTVSAALGDVLHYAAFNEEAGSTVSFTNQGYGILEGHLLEREGRLYINTSQTADDAPNATLLVLVSDGAYTDMAIRDFTMTYEDGLFTGGYTIAGGERTRPITFAFQPVNG